VPQAACALSRAGFSPPDRCVGGEQLHAPITYIALHAAKSMAAWSQCSIMMHSPGHSSAASTAESRTPSDDLFHEPDAQPKTVIAGSRPEATLRGHRSHIGTAPSVRQA
jgi:hypothetical protein